MGTLKGLALGVGVAIGLLVGPQKPLAGPPSEAVVGLQVVSSPAEYVTGGDALVEARLPAGASLSVRLNGADVSAAFAPEPGRPERRLGLLRGLPLGQSALTAELGPAHAALKLTNYPLTGPVLSGPHDTPFFCQTQDFALPDGSKLPPPLDPASCAVPTSVQYVYKPVGSEAFKPLAQPGALPADVDVTTTTLGVRAPFVVRIETGVIDRGIYQFAVLHDPTREAQPAPTAPPSAWNHRLVSIQGFGCPGGWYIQGAALGNSPARTGGFRADILDPVRLGQGYAVASNTLQHPSNNCNAVLASEAGMMTKEKFVETFGPPVWTVSHGCSGGSYGSLQLADRMPGLYDGVLIACTFPDPLAIAVEGQDSHLLTHYFGVTNPGGFTDAQKLAVTGYKGIKAFEDAANQAGRTDPVPGRVDIAGYKPAVFNAAVPESARYDPVKNRQGLRGTVYDAARGVLGVDRVTGFARRPFDNVGVQYGLRALKAGQISKAQFLDLNARVGGYDTDDNYAPGRSQGDLAAIRRAKLSGLQTGGRGGLTSIPVFDVSGLYNDDSGYHYQWFHFAMRERLRAANGATNHVMWRGAPVPYEQAWTAFAAWVDRYKADQGPGPQLAKVVRAKTIQDGCFDAAGAFVAEPQTFSAKPDSRCNRLLPSYAATRLMAGGPLSADVLKCRLKPVAAGDYGPVRFTASELGRLKAVFPTGVCDWGKGDASGVKGSVPYGSVGPSPLNRID